MKALRSQGNAPAAPNRARGKSVNRQMRRKMKSQGIEGMEPIEAKKVIIETDTGNIVIESPQVIKLVQQGMEIYQVIGKAEAGEEDEEIEDGKSKGKSFRNDQKMKTKKLVQNLLISMQK